MNPASHSHATPADSTRLGSEGPLRGARPGLSELLAQLADRLGPEALLRPVPSDRLRPEEGWTSASPGLRRSPDRRALSPCRPSLLLPSPPPLRLRTDAVGTPAALLLGGRWRRVRAAAGPERLTGRWWEAQPLDRDYYRLVLAGPPGRAPWVYRDRRDGSWWLHGWFD